MHHVNSATGCGKIKLKLYLQIYTFFSILEIYLFCGITKKNKVLFINDIEINNTLNKFYVLDEKTTLSPLLLLSA